MAQELPDFARVRVLVAGDVMLDRYCAGDAARISPEAPVPVVRVHSVSDRPGGAGNVALNLAALGAAVRLAGFTGDDAEAELVERALRAAAVDCRLQRLPGVRTVTKLRVVARRQQLLRLDFEDTPVSAAPLSPALVDGCDALLLSDYAKGCLARPGALIEAARRRGLPVLVDPKGTDWSRYRGATLLTPNLREFEAAVGACGGEVELVARGRKLMQDLDLQALVITRGGDGMTLLEAGGEATHLPARAREVFDVTGAGDTVLAVLGAALAGGAGLLQAVTLANTAAGIAVGRSGAAAVSAAELAGEDATERGVLGLERLQSAVARARARGERVVFTNGCFDLLHAGHVGYLQQARRLGDRLVVAVNSDASVRRLKGEGRPINSQERRMAVLAGLESVDWVVGFDADTPQELLRTLRPEVLVKGGDYRRKEDVVGWEIVESYGGEVRIAGEFPGASTSGLVRRIRDSSEG